MPTRSLARIAAPACILLIAVLGTGCATPLDPVRPTVPGELAELNRGYAALASLLGDERKVHQILAIKNENLPVRLLTQEIAAASAEADDTLTQLRSLDPPLNLEQPPGLPMIEAATRDSIAMETALDLLFSTDTFETRLLLSQGQALRYGQCLAIRLKEADPNEERSAWLGELATEYERLYKDIVDALHRADSAPTNAAAQAGD